MPRFNRIVRVQIVSPLREPAGLVERQLLDTGILGGGSLEFSGLKISFRVKKTESSDPNTCTLTIFNLNEDSRSKINIEKSQLYLFAGYEQDTGEELVFTGNVTNVNDTIQRPNVVSVIDAADGEKELNESKMSVSFKEGVTLFQIFEKVIDTFNLPVKFKKALEFTKKVKYNNGSAFIGQAKALMDLLTADVRLTWSIQNGELKFYENTKADFSSAVVLTTNTGLIGSPTKIKVKKGTRTEEKESDGWKFVSLLQPKIEPGGIVKVTSREILDGSQFKVINVDHDGDSIEGSFQTTVEAMQL